MYVIKWCAGRCVGAVWLSCTSKSRHRKVSKESRKPFTNHNFKISTAMLSFIVNQKFETLSFIHTSSLIWLLETVIAHNSDRPFFTNLFVFEYRHRTIYSWNICRNPVACLSTTLAAKRRDFYVLGLTVVIVSVIDFHHLWNWLLCCLRNWGLGFFRSGINVEALWRLAAVQRRCFCWDFSYFTASVFSSNVWASKPRFIFNVLCKLDFQFQWNHLVHITLRDWIWNC